MRSLPTGTRRQLVAGAFLLGVGLMGVLDVAIFHEMLGWHHLLSARTSDPRTNELADGVFHLGTSVVTVVGVALLWRAASHLPEVRGGRHLVAGALLGGASFNVAEVTVDHLLLRLHTLHPSGDLRLDTAFLGANFALAAAAAWAIRRAPEPPAGRILRRRRRAFGE
ncbi:MAG TPA: DUF2243 domain-containing protein [Candidatus Thermoplasmatota archaeon]|nr:DUF2243 domain-containing protein [Candidatus Thermoplasmatota archaeon]